MSKGVYRIYFLIICFLGTVLSILLGFMFSTVYDLMKTHYETFGAALTSVLKNPFSCYFNFYTPLFGIVIFLVFEVGIFIAYFVLNKNNGEDYEEELEEDYIEENIYEENAENKKKRSYNPDQDFFSSMLDAADVENIEIDRDADEFLSEDIEDIFSEEKIENNENEESELSFSSEITDGLISAGFDPLQISAMLNIKKYVNDISVDVLCNIFNNSMSVDKIEEYIRLFYE